MEERKDVEVVMNKIKEDRRIINMESKGEIMEEKESLMIVV